MTTRLPPLRDNIVASVAMTDIFFAATGLAYTRKPVSLRALSRLASSSVGGRCHVFWNAAI